MKIGPTLTACAILSIVAGPLAAAKKFECQALVESYLDFKKTEERKRTDRALEALEAEVKAQEDLVRKKRELFQKMLRARVDVNGPEYLETEKDLNSARSFLEKMKKENPRHQLALKRPKVKISIVQLPSLATKPVK